VPKSLSDRALDGSVAFADERADVAHAMLAEAGRLRPEREVKPARFLGGRATQRLPCPLGSAGRGGKLTDRARAAPRRARRVRCARRRR
jgi:hypothetical protein